MREDTSRNPDPRYADLTIGVSRSVGCLVPAGPEAIPWETALQEMADAGFSVMETGPFGYFPTEPTRLREVMDTPRLPRRRRHRLGHPAQGGGVGRDRGVLPSDR